MANLQIVISALNKASGDLSKVKGDIKGVGDAGTKAKGGVEGFGDGLGSIVSKAALVAGAAAAVGVALKEVYDTAKEGAELEYARTRFDNLSASIGTVSDALLGDLRDATKGMMSDAELVAGAADFMALGLAKSHDEVVRLTTVAGALGMNMNQLVLTLTNQTTMRFDALGVSVDGFDAKVKALEASGLSANEAFTEAFLQQAEAQIEKVGNKAESSAGQVQIMESAFKNLGDAIKLTTADALDGLAPVLTSLADHMTENVQVGQQFGDVIGDLKDLQKAGVISGKEYNAMLRDIGIHSGMGAVTTEQLAKAQEYLDQTIGYTSDGVITYTEAVQMGQAQLALMAAESESAATATETVADATNNADMAMRGYTESLLFKIASEGLSAEAAYDLAVAMGLVDQNTVAATKQTNVYKQMLDAGIISQSQYNLLVKDLADDIENLPEGKTLEIDDNIDDVLADLADLETWKVKPIPVTLSVDDSGVRNYNPPTKTGTVVYQPNRGMNYAVGGAVNAGNPYNWQEYGYRGEVFVPSADGFVLSRADAERALARALYGGGSAISPEEIGKAVASAMSGITSSKKGGNVYNLTMPTSSNPADIRTAFELMEAWA
jgi:hypothetical protein